MNWKQKVLALILRHGFDEAIMKHIQGLGDPAFRQLVADYNVARDRITAALGIAGP